MRDSCDCEMAPERPSRVRTLFLGLTLAAAASFTASSAFAATVLLSAADGQAAGTQPAASCCGYCIPGVPCCGYCRLGQGQI